MSPHLGCYGDAHAVTPNLDRLAEQGVRYRNAFATAALCTPARSSLITGVFASTLGTQNLRGVQPLSANMHCFTEFLREAGYYCTNNVKEDYNFITPANAWDESSETAHWRNGPKGKAFFSVFNLMTTHQSRTRYDRDTLAEVNESLSPQERYDPDTLPLPPYYPDTPLVRDNLAAFYTQVTIMDKEVQVFLDALAEDGLSDNTIVFFYSDHGDGLPRGKRWLFDTGLRVPLIIRFPEKYQDLASAPPGSVLDRMVSFVDFAPTVLSLAGINIPGYMQGSAFLGVQEGPEPDTIVAIRDRVDEVLEVSRAIRDRRYKYIRNFMPHRPRMQRSFYSEMTPIRQEIRRLHAEGKLHGDAAYLMQPDKPAEELYDTVSDPYEMVNLAASSQHAAVMEQLRTALFQWMLKTRDSGLLPESDLLSRAEGKMPYDVTGDDAAYPIERILNTADLVGRGKEKLEQLQAGLSDDDSAVRYWAATGLAALGGDAKPATAQLLQGLADQTASVRLAAAEALCGLGHAADALPVLAAALLDKDITIQLHAAEVLVAIDSKARPLLPEMQSAIKRAEGLQDHGWYLLEALSYLVTKLTS
jgi:uncharacterized sulfatase